MPIVCDPYGTSVITNMTGGIVWQAEHKDVGNKEIVARLDISFDECKWNCFVRNLNSDEKICTDPTRKFTIVCNPISYFADYYQQYQNLERSFNTEKRNAQYDKQQLDAIGDVVASTLWHGTSSGQPTKGDGGKFSMMPKSAGVAIAGAALGGTVQVAIQSYSLGEYNKKLSDIENRQAKLQYDKYNALGNSVMDFVVGGSVPRMYIMDIDVESSHDITTLRNITYNSGITSTDAEDLFLNSQIAPPKYLSGDFDFYKIPLKDGIQLNARLKTGVEFVLWSDEQ